MLKWLTLDYWILARVTSMTSTTYRFPPSSPFKSLSFDTDTQQVSFVVAAQEACLGLFAELSNDAFKPIAAISPKSQPYSGSGWQETPHGARRYAHSDPLEIKETAFLYRIRENHSFGEGLLALAEAIGNQGHTEFGGTGRSTLLESFGIAQSEQAAPAHITSPHIRRHRHTHKFQPSGKER